MPFTSLTFESDISSGTLYFMGPNSQFRSSLSRFYSGLNSDDLDSYYLMLSHLKQFYAKQSPSMIFYFSIIVVNHLEISLKNGIKRVFITCQKIIRFALLTLQVVVGYLSTGR